MIPATGSNPRARQPPEPHRGGNEDAPAASRALVSVERPVRPSTLRSTRPDASFVAHLIAMAEQAPQTRNARRATPADARAVYDRAMARGAVRDGKGLSQTA